MPFSTMCSASSTHCYKDVAPLELLLIRIKLFEYVSSTYDRQVSGEKKSPRNLCVLSVSVLKKYLNRFGEPLFSRLTSIWPKPGNGVIFLFYKDVAPTELLHYFIIRDSSFEILHLVLSASTFVSKRWWCAEGNWNYAYFYHVFRKLHPLLQRCRSYGASSPIHHCKVLIFPRSVKQIFNPISYITSAF